MCDDSWDVDDAKVACRKVGYPIPSGFIISLKKALDFLTSTVYTDPTVYASAAFGQGNLPILLDDVSCDGSESTLTSCAYDSHTADCNHADDAGVTCQYGI